MEKNLPGAAGVLDIDHASEHLHASAVALHGEAAAGLLEELAAEAGDVSGLVGYLGPHRDHTDDRHRLAEGRSIGSGMVERACKPAIGQRLKQTGARWKVRRLERTAALCCLHYGDQFDADWQKAAG